MTNRIKQNIKTLLIPYLSTGFFYYIVWLIKNPYEFSCRHIIALITGIGTMPVTGAIQWFLTAMFFADIIYALTIKTIKNRYVMSAFMLFVAMLGMLNFPFKKYIPWRRV